MRVFFFIVNTILSKGVFGFHYKKEQLVGRFTENIARARFK